MDYIKMKKDSRIYIAGHNGMVGSAIYRKLINEGYTNIITREKDDLDLRRNALVSSFFHIEEPEYVFLCAAKVGGIIANQTYPASFMYDNITIGGNVIHNSFLHGVKKVLNLGSSCIYPNNITRSIREEDLLTGPLESTNEAYALAKITTLKLCQYYNEQSNRNTDFLSVMPCNLYGTNDNYDTESSHVLPAIIKKLVDAKNNNSPSVEFWGNGESYREFLHVDDLADVCVLLMEKYTSEDINNYINVGSGIDIKIKNLVSTVQTLIGYYGKILWDNDKPNGTYKKLLDSSKINEFGWSPKISLKDGLLQTIEEYTNLD